MKAILRILIAGIFLLSPHLYLDAQQVAINEVMASNKMSIADEDGDFSDWVELYNYGESPVELTGYGLSDNYEAPFKWVFPELTLQPQTHLLVWCSGKNRQQTDQPLHTSFSISADGEEIILSHPNGDRVDEMAPTPMIADQSYGRYPDGTGKWYFYTAASPQAPNGSDKSPAAPEPPLFSTNSGFYSDAFTLQLTHPDEEAIIVYTLDGSIPSYENLSGVDYQYKNQYPQNPGQATGALLRASYTSHLYSEALTINDRSPEANKLANISSTWHFEPDYFPNEPIKKATVIRAVAIVDGLSSQVVTKTYFVAQAANFSSSLPIVALALNEDGLFDYEKGIYVAGQDFDNWRSSRPYEQTSGHVPANYRRRGVETEQAAYFQYFHNGQEVLSQNIGLRLHGSFTRSIQNKSFRLYARSDYDTQNTFEYPIFGPTNSKSFKRLVLRNSGNDAGNEWIGGALVPTISPAVYFRDALIQKIAAPLNLDTQDYQPAIIFVNGEYWGLLNIRERYDHHYLNRVYGIEEEDLEYLTGNASVETGTNSHFISTRNFIQNSNMTVARNYDHAKTLIDIDNFIDYQLIQIFARNTDWPGNNIDYFRKSTNEYMPNAPKGQDGRWRWLLFDTDHGFGWSGDNSYTHNTLESASRSSDWATVILFKLLQNQSFKNQFINRYADLLNSAFLPERTLALIDEMANNIAAEIPLHQKRWNTLHNWVAHIQHMREFAEKRPIHARNHILQRFGLSGSFDLDVNVSDPEQGYVRANSLDIRPATKGLSDTPYPWTGTYFKNVPIRLTAIPLPGYKFSHWTGDLDDTEAEQLLTTSENTSVKAHFVPLEEGELELLYFWLFDNNMANNTPLQTLAPSYSATANNAQLSYRSALGPDYPFSSDHANWRKASMERRNAPTEIGYYPKANNNLNFEATNMRALQIKQPFLQQDFENTMVLNFSTSSYKNIRIEMAVKDEGAAKDLIFDYYDNEQQRWKNTGLSAVGGPLSEEYQLYTVDLSTVTEAINNENFKLRIRFNGPDMTEDEGQRVSFNNISIHGKAYTTSSLDDLNEAESDKIHVVPNPFVRSFTISSSRNLNGATYELSDLAGRPVQTGQLTGRTTFVKAGPFPPGVYLLKIKASDTVVVKLIKKQ